MRKGMKKIGFILLVAILASCSSTRKANDTQRDESHYEKAIVVESVRAEYEYVRKDCPDCQFVEQMLVFHKKKPYDILVYKKPDGEKVYYYFDISKFYGKAFK